MENETSDAEDACKKMQDLTGDGQEDRLVE